MFPAFFFACIRRASRVTRFAILLLAGPGASGAGAAETFDADIAIYGGTSGGVIAAVQAARLGKTAVILEPGRHLGGMTSGGLSAVDIGDPRTVGGLTRDYFTRLAARYGQTLPWEQKHATGHGTGGAFAVEPHAAEELFETFVKEAGAAVRVLRDARLASVKKDVARIAEATLEDGRAVRARMWIDASYEGDLLAKAGVATIVGREANSQYGETLNGWRISLPPLTRFGPIGANGRDKTGRGAWMRTIALDPFVVPGKPESGLLPLVSPMKMGTPGEAAPGVQAYCFRLCMTDDPANRLPVAPPANYDPGRYELQARYIAACLAAGDQMDMRWFCMPLPLPGKKYDFNTAWLGANSPGLGWGWAEASYAEREKLAKQHEDHQRGLLHFLTTDPRVPQNIRDEFARFGLPRDEFRDTGGWPHQLYIREARRMVSDFVMTEHHAYGRQVAPQPVALASYGVDTHEAQRIEHGGIVVDEGKLMGHPHLPGPYPIGYGAIVPRASECENVFATFAISASHVCFASTRMEPVLMMLSEAAADAAAQAIDAGVSVQKVNAAKLRAQLEKDRAVLAWPVATKTATAATVEPKADPRGYASLDLSRGGVQSDLADMRPRAKVVIAGREVNPAQPPAGLQNRADLGLLLAAGLEARPLQRWPQPRFDAFEKPPEAPGYLPPKGPIAYVDCPRPFLAPGGDLLLMVVAGDYHYGGQPPAVKMHDIIPYRPRDGAKTWDAPSKMPNRFNQHAWVPLVPRRGPHAGKRIAVFYTMPAPGDFNGHENAGIAWRFSDDDGRTWSEPERIRPANDPGFQGMWCINATETARGTWLLAPHAADWTRKTGDAPLETQLYLLHSEDQGKTWTLLPGARPDGWQWKPAKRMDEGRPIRLHDDKVALFARTQEGHIWRAISEDDGKTWSEFEPTALVHPDAPPMIQKLPDGRLLALHHNRHSGGAFNHDDRTELWAALSSDDGDTWNEGRFFAVATTETTRPFWGRSFASLTYSDSIVLGDTLHVFIPHAWRQVVELTLPVAAPGALPTTPQLQAAP